MEKQEKQERLIEAAVNVVNKAIAAMGKSQYGGWNGGSRYLIDAKLGHELNAAIAAYNGLRDK